MEDKFAKCCFIWSSSQLLLHDKNCHYVKRIKQSNKIMSKKKNCVLGMQLCKCCRQSMLIRYLLGNAYMDNYKALFDAVNMSTLDKLVFKKKVEVIPYHDFLHFTCEEDEWLLRLSGEGRVTLWHNNYVRTLDGKRYFKNGYHLQIDGTISLTVALNTIVNYKYDSSHRSLSKTCT